LRIADADGGSGVSPLNSEPGRFCHFALLSKNEAGFSQFPPLDFHRQGSRPYPGHFMVW
jgi:hypothetical protein